MSNNEADLVLTGGKVRTPAHPSGFAEALAVRGGVIAVHDPVTGPLVTPG